MAGNALGRLYIKVAQEQTIPGETDFSTGQAPTQGSNIAPGAGTAYGQTVPTGGTPFWQMLAPFAGEAEQLVNSVAILMQQAGVMPAAAAAAQRTGVGPSDAVAGSIRQQLAATGAAALTINGAAFKNVLLDKRSGAGAQLAGLLMDALPEKVARQLTVGAATLDPKTIGMFAQMIVPMLDARVTQMLPKLVPGLILDPSPLREAYMRTHAGKFNAADFDKFVTGTHRAWASGAFAPRNPDGSIGPAAAFPMQDAANATVFAAQMAPPGTPPERLLAYTANVAQNVHALIDKIEGLDVTTAYRILNAQSNPRDVLSNPKAVAQFAAQLGDIAGKTGMRGPDIAGNLELARRTGLNPAVAMQALVQNAQLGYGLQQGGIGNINEQRRNRLQAGYGQATTSGIHNSYNTKMLAALASIDPRASAGISRALQTGNSSALQSYLQQAMKSPAAWQTFRTADTSDIEQAIGSAGSTGLKAFLTMEVNDQIRRSRMPELARMSSKELQKRMQTRDYRGLSPQARIALDRPEFASVFASTRGLTDLPEEPQAKTQIPQVPESPIPRAPQLESPPQAPQTYTSPIPRFPVAGQAPKPQ